MLKWWLLSGYFAGCLLVAGLVYVRGVRQVKYYTALLALTQQLSTKISYARQPVRQIITDFLPVAGTITPLLTAYQALLVARADVTREKCRQLTTDLDVAEFLYQLGRTGSTEETAKLKAVTALFTSKQEQAQSNFRGKTSIQVKLLIIMGIAGVILWI